jgi:hypothetical protein
MSMVKRPFKVLEKLIIPFVPGIASGGLRRGNKLLVHVIAPLRAIGHQGSF